MRTRGCIAFVGAAMVALSALASSVKADPLKIRADWIVLPGFFAPLIPTVPQYGPNVYRHYGKSYVVEPIHIQGGSTTITSLAVGDTDLATLSPQTLVFAVANAKLDVHIIGLQIATEVPGYLQSYFWVHASEIKRIDDLKGRVIGISQRGAPASGAAEMVMIKHGFHEPRDYRFLEVPLSAQFAALEEHKVDAAVLVAPFHLQARQDPGLKPLFGVADAFGTVETVMWAVKSDFLAKNRAALVDFLEDNIRMRRWMFDPKTRMDAVKQLADTAKVPIARFADWVYSNGDYYYDPDAMVDVALLQKNVNDMKTAGIIAQAIDVRPYVDMSLATEAAASARMR